MKLMPLWMFIAVAFAGNLLLPSGVVAAGDLSSIRGVSLPSTEWACVQYNQTFDYPLETTIELLKRWNIDTVRIPFNQECWLDKAEYQTEITAAIEAFGEAELDVIIDLHWNNPTGASKGEQQVMADAERSEAFWESIVDSFGDNDSVIAFELYNEPHSINYDCWLNGCTSPEGWQTTGMQDLVDAVRDAGANQWLIVNGLGWANDVIGAIENRPQDPEGKLAFGWHVYDEFADSSKCVTVECFNEKIAPLAEDFEIVITEFGSRLHCDPNHDEGVMRFAEENGIGFVAWGWYPADCGFPALISDWSGTPTNAGWRVCTYLKGNCSAVPQVTELPPALKNEAVLPPALDTLCFISFKNGVIKSDQAPCTGGHSLELSGSTDQTWNDRISSWTVSGGWFALASWDYYTTSGRVEKGNELWLGSQGNVAPDANDRIRWMIVRPTATGALTVHENIDGGGPTLTFKLK